MYSGLNEAIERLENNPDIGILGLQIKDENLQMDQFLDLEDARKDGEDIADFLGLVPLSEKKCTINSAALQNGFLFIPRSLSML